MWKIRKFEIFDGYTWNAPINIRSYDKKIHLKLNWTGQYYTATQRGPQKIVNNSSGASFNCNGISPLLLKFLVLIAVRLSIRWIKSLRQQIFFESLAFFKRFDNSVDLVLVSIQAAALHSSLSRSIGWEYGSCNDAYLSYIKFCLYYKKKVVFCLYN